MLKAILSTATGKAVIPVGLDNSVYWIATRKDVDRQNASSIVASCIAFELASIKLGLQFYQGAQKKYFEAQESKNQIYQSSKDDKDLIGASAMYVVMSFFLLRPQGDAKGTYEALKKIFSLVEMYANEREKIDFMNSLA